MRKVIATLVLSLTVVLTFAQSNEVPKKLKYVTQAPDGSVAMTIYDSSSDDTMKLESASTFYKYQILDPKTGKSIHTASNAGKACTIDKLKVKEGTYDIRLYTNKFVITSKIIVSAPSNSAYVASKGTVAMND